MNSVSNWFNPAVWKATGRTLKITAKKEYNLIYLLIMVVVVIFTGLATNGFLRTHPDPTYAMTRISTVVMGLAVFVSIGMLTLQYNNIYEGKVLRMRLLPNGINVYGLTLVATVPLIFAPVMVLAVVVALLLIGFGAWLWAVKLLCVSILLMMFCLPWMLMLGTLIRNSTTFIVIFLGSIVFITGVTGLSRLSYDAGLSRLPAWLNPWVVSESLSSWTAGVPSPRLNPGLVLLALAAIGLVGYTVFVLAFPALTRRGAAKTSNMQQTTNTYSFGKGW